MEKEEKQKELERLQELLKIRQREYEDFGKTSEDGQYDLKIKRKIQELLEV